MKTPPTPEKIRIQPNRTFADETDMHDWLRLNLPEFELSAHWEGEDGRLSCTVEGLPPKGKKK